MEAVIIILEISPRLQYLKTHENDFFSISFLYDNDIVKIDNLEKYINNQESLNIPISNSNFSKNQELHFYFIKNGSIIIGIGEIPLINSIKWFNLNILNKSDNLLNKKTITSPSNNNGSLKEIINTYNIKIKLSVEIKNHNCDNTNIINALQKSISIKGNADSNTNSICNTCTNSKTPKTIKNPTIHLLTNNKNSFKNPSLYYKKLETHNKKRSGNTTLFSAINKRLLRNRTEKKLIHHKEKRDKIFSFNDYYEMNYNNNNTEVYGSSLNITLKKNTLNLTNLKKDNYNLDKKRKQILKTIEKLNMDKSKNNSSKMLDFILPKNDDDNNNNNKNKANKKIKIKTKNLFMKQNNKRQKSVDEKNINSNSLRKIEEVIIDQNFKNKIKNDELIGITSNINSNISSLYSSKSIGFFNINNDENNIFEQNMVLDMSENDDDILLMDFNNKKKDLFNIYNLEYIINIKDNNILLEMYSFIQKIIKLYNDYQTDYKKLFFNFNKYKKLFELFKILLLNNIKKKNKLDYIKTSLSIKENKNVLINTGLKNYSDTRNIIIHNNDIPFLNNLLCCNNNDNPINNLNKIKYNKKKIEFIQIFLKICHGKEKYFNSLSKKCYNDIKKKYSDELIKNKDKHYNSLSKLIKISNNISNFHMNKSSTKNNFYSTENSATFPKSKYNSKKSSNTKKEGLIIEKNKVSTFSTKNISKNRKTNENIRYQKK